MSRDAANTGSESIAKRNKPSNYRDVHDGLDLSDFTTWGTFVLLGILWLSASLRTGFGCVRVSR